MTGDRWRAALSGGIIAFVHVAVASYLQVHGLVMEPLRLWQLVDEDLLKSRLLESLWYLPSQPPLYNLILGLFVKGGGEHVLFSLWIFNVALGVLMLLMIKAMISQFSNRPVAAFWATLLFAFNPALFEYEAFPLYSHATAFLVTLHCWSVARLARAVTRLNIALCLLSLVALIMVRASYLPYLVLPGILYVFLMTQSRARVFTLAAAAFAIVIPFGWCVKNTVQHQFFGLCCWRGMNLYHRASAFYEPDDLKQLAQEGVIDQVAATVPPFTNASAYRPFGFTRTSRIPVLSRDDLNNVNQPAISRVYGKDAVRLIRHDPLQYWRTTCVAAQLYAAPCGGYRRVQPEIPFYSWLDDAWSDWMLGMGLWKGDATYYFSPFVAALMFSVLIGALSGVARLLRGRYSVEDFRQNAALAVIRFFILYNAAVSILAEYGENNRFRYDVEPICYVIAAVLVLRAGAALVRLAMPRIHLLKVGLTRGLASRV